MYMGEITIRKAFDDYKTVHMAYRNFADRTREEYQNDIEDFVRFLEQSWVNNVGELSLPIIERYVAHLEERGIASLTRKRKVVVIRSLLSFLYQDGYIDTNIVKKIVLPLAEYPSPNFLTQSECNKLRSVCADSPRDIAIIELILQTGIKLSELVHLTVNDIELIGTGRLKGLMRVKGSLGRMERIIPLNTKACDVLKNYLDTRKDAQESVLLLNRFSEPLTASGVQKMLRKYLKKAKIEEASIHTLRHTFGAYHVARGTDPKTVQDVMGLKDDRSAAIYQSLAREVVSRELQDHAL
jgi:site-specific recombinase XerD